MATVLSDTADFYATADIPYRFDRYGGAPQVTPDGYTNSGLAFTSAGDWVELGNWGSVLAYTCGWCGMVYVPAFSGEFTLLEFWQRVPARDPDAIPQPTVADRRMGYLNLAGTGALRWMRNGVVVAAATQYGVPLGEWCFINVRVHFDGQWTDPAGFTQGDPAGEGWVQVYINGYLAINSEPTAISESYVTDYYTGCWANAVRVGCISGASASLTVDDWRITNNPTGSEAPARGYVLRPTALYEASNWPYNGEGAESVAYIDDATPDYAATMNTQLYRATNLLDPPLTDTPHPSHTLYGFPLTELETIVWVSLQVMCQNRSLVPDTDWGSIIEPCAVGYVKAVFSGSTYPTGLSSSNYYREGWQCVGSCRDAPYASWRWPSTRWYPDVLQAHKWGVASDWRLVRTWELTPPPPHWKVWDPLGYVDVTQIVLEAYGDGPTLGEPPLLPRRARPWLWVIGQ